MDPLYEIRVEQLELLREEQPLVWAVLVLGPCTPARLAKILLRHPDSILDDLRLLKKDGLVTDTENTRKGAPMVWEVTSRLSELYNWRADTLRSWKVK